MPFTRCDNNELLNIISTNSMKFLEALSNLEIVNETRTFSDVSSNDINNGLPSKTSCKLMNMNFLIKNKISTSSTAILMA